MANQSCQANIFVTMPQSLNESCVTLEGRESVLAALVDGTEKLYGDEEFADFTILCGTRTFKVHKTVLCPRSAFFGAACKKNTFKEGRENSITLISNAEAEEGDDPAIIALMIEFFYCLDYTVASKLYAVASDADDNGADGQDADADDNVDRDDVDNVNVDDKRDALPEDRTLTTHARVFAAAEKFGVPSLQTQACINFVEYLRTHRISSEDLAEAIQVIYKSTPDTCLKLRECLKAALQDLSLGFFEDANITVAIQAVPELLYALFRAEKKRAEELRNGNGWDGRHENGLDGWN